MGSLTCATILVRAVHMNPRQVQFSSAASPVGRRWDVSLAQLVRAFDRDAAYAGSIPPGAARDFVPRVNI